MADIRFIVLMLMFIWCVTICVALYKHNENLEDLVSRFNKWTANSIKSSKLSTALNHSNGSIEVQASENIEGKELLFEISSDYIINSDTIYKGKLREFALELDSKYTYDESIYLILQLVYEREDSESKFKPFIDILPYDVPSVAYQYEENKAEITEVLKKSVALRKIIEYNTYSNFKTDQIFNQIVSEYPKHLDPKVFNKQNIKWAILICDFYSVIHDSR